MGGSPITGSAFQVMAPSLRARYPVPMARPPTPRPVVGPSLSRPPLRLTVVVALFFAGLSLWGWRAGVAWLGFTGLLFSAWTLALGWLLARKRR